MNAQEARSPEPELAMTRAGHPTTLRQGDASLPLPEYQPHALSKEAPRRDADADADIIPAQPSHEMERELARLPRHQILCENGDFRAVVLGQSQAPRVVLEIGRLREIAFRAIGEGTGRVVDLDDYDTYYRHLLVWNVRERAVLGSYRLALADVVSEQLGVDALYTRSLFTYDASLLEAIGPAIELGRSFVRKEHQRSSRVLAMLWKGIGRLVSASPRYHTLFGPVTLLPRIGKSRVGVWPLAAGASG